MALEISRMFFIDWTVREKNFVSMISIITMALKMTEEHSNDLRELVIKNFLNGKTERDIVRDVFISCNTVHSIIKKYKSKKCVANMWGSGRKRKTIANVDRVIQRKIKVDRRKSALSVKSELQTELGLTISESTIRRRLYEIGLNGRVARKKPYVNKDNRVQRLYYAKMYLEKPLGYWNEVLWSDETKFNLFGSDGKVMVWRTTKEEMEPKCTVPTVKRGGGSVMCWGCMLSAGVGKLAFIDGNMTREMHRRILENNLLDSVRMLSLGNGWIFQHDNDPKHRAAVVTTWLNGNNTERINWPSFSPDLNPIEHLWDEVEHRMKKTNPRNVTELKECLVRIWKNIESQVCKKLVDSVPSRLHEVLRMKGYPTRY